MHIHIYRFFLNTKTNFLIVNVLIKENKVYNQSVKSRLRVLEDKYIARKMSNKSKKNLKNERKHRCGGGVGGGGGGAGEKTQDEESERVLAAHANTRSDSENAVEVSSFGGR